MRDDATQIIRGTFWWGVATTGVAAIVSACGARLDPFAVGVGACYAVGAIQFYSIVVAAMFGEAGSLRRFLLFLPIKLALLVALVLYSRTQTAHELLALVLGSLVFIPAAFRHALREAAAEMPSENCPDDDTRGR